MRKRAKPSLINPKVRRKQQSRRGKLIFLIGMAVAIILLIAYHQNILSALGRYLVYQQDPQQADVIVIPANWDDTIVRARGGIDLYNRGLAKTIFVPRMERMKGLEEIIAQGIDIPENRDILITIFEKFGIPLTNIETSAQEVTNTWDEAQEVRNFVEKRGYTTVLLVTSKYHSRRAYLIFKDALKGQATVISVPTPYDASDPEVWWKRNDKFQSVIMEYQKLLAYYWLKVF
jgi:uncharacterized SAM-binding protein YcdF (DUF218 family)